MIHVKVIVTGEPDVPPLTKIFQDDTNSEKAFLSSVLLIKDRLKKNLRININETLLVYCAFVVNELRDGKPINVIQNNAKKVLSVDNVMIGVPESIRKISLEISIYDKPTITIILDEPIPTSDYILVPKT